MVAINDKAKNSQEFFDKSLALRNKTCADLARGIRGEEFAESWRNSYLLGIIVKSFLNRKTEDLTKYYYDKEFKEQTNLNLTSEQDVKDQALALKSLTRYPVIIGAVVLGLLFAIAGGLVGGLVFGPAIGAVGAVFAGIAIGGAVGALLGAGIGYIDAQFGEKQAAKFVEAKAKQAVSIDINKLDNELQNESISKNQEKIKQIEEELKKLKENPEKDKDSNKTVETLKNQIKDLESKIKDKTELDQVQGLKNQITDLATNPATLKKAGKKAKEKKEEIPDDLLKSLFTSEPSTPKKKNPEPAKKEPELTPLESFAKSASESAKSQPQKEPTSQKKQ